MWRFFTLPVAFEKLSSIILYKNTVSEDRIYLWPRFRKAPVALKVSLEITLKVDLKVGLKVGFKRDTGPRPARSVALPPWPLRTMLKIHK